MHTYAVNSGITGKCKMKIPSNAVTTWITPRVSETDGCGHINNTTLPVWFEAGRREFFRAVSPGLSFDGWNLAVVSMRLDFRRQIYLADEVKIETWVSKIGNKSISVSEIALQNDNICTAGECSYVFFDYKTQKSEIVPEAIRQRLSFMVCESERALTP